MNDFNFDKFRQKIALNRNIISVILEKDIVKIIFKDNLQLNICIAHDEYHKFYTFMNYIYKPFYYYDKMPHDSYSDLYHEIKRISNPNTRTQKCKSNYIKSF